MQPEYPESAQDQGGEYVGIVEVAVGDDDQLVDAWTFAGSGNRAIDLTALRAALGSTYGDAISYCQHVRGYYIFRADFLPY